VVYRWSSLYTTAGDLSHQRLADLSGPRVAGIGSEIDSVGVSSADDMLTGDDVTQCIVDESRSGASRRPITLVVRAGRSVDRDATFS